MLSDLKALRDILTASIDTITNGCEGAGIDFPSLNEPFWSSTTDPRRQSEISEAIAKVVAASEQLIATVQAPQLTLWNYSASVSITCMCGICISALIPRSFTFLRVLVSQKQQISLRFFVRQDPRYGEGGECLV